MTRQPAHAAHILQDFLAAVRFGWGGFRKSWELRRRKRAKNRRLTEEALNRRPDND